MSSARTLVIVALGCTVALACGATPDTTRATDQDEEAPLTDADPPPYTPPPTPRGDTGDVVSLGAAGGYEQARAVALRLLRAVRDADEAALTELLAEQVGRVLPRLSSPNRERGALVRHAVQSPTRGDLGPGQPLETLVDLDRIEVIPLSRHQRGQPLPPGLLGSDLLVTVPLTNEGRQHLRLLLGWMLDGTVLVRPGVEPVIVAL